MKKVRCIDDFGLGTGEVKKGDVYELVSVINRDGENLLQLAKNGKDLVYRYRENRFVLLSDDERETLPSIPAAKAAPEKDQLSAFFRTCLSDNSCFCTAPLPCSYHPKGKR